MWWDVRNSRTTSYAKNSTFMALSTANTIKEWKSTLLKISPREGSGMNVNSTYFLFHHGLRIDIDIEFFATFLL